MLKKILVASFLLVASMGSQATIIEYGNYKRDTSGTCAVTEADCKYNIVTGGGLEWLMWDVTKGLSINEALAAHGADGWTLASNVQMASLFNVFQFGRTNWIAIESIRINKYIPWDDLEESPHIQFMRLFGYTQWEGDPNYLQADPLAMAAAFYGSDENNDSLYKIAYVQDDSRYSYGYKNGSDAELLQDWWGLDTKISNHGVALVKEVRIVPPTQVSLPGSLSLLALGFVALGFRRRKA